MSISFAPGVMFDQGFFEMLSLAYNTVRGAILGLMVILAVVSSGYCDTYDADPYDDVPPVTIELNFVVPAMAATAHTPIVIGSHNVPGVMRRDVSHNFHGPIADVHSDSVPFSALATLPVLLPLRT